MATTTAPSTGPIGGRAFSDDESTTKTQQSAGGNRSKTGWFPFTHSKQKREKIVTVTTHSNSNSSAEHIANSSSLPTRPGSAPTAAATLPLAAKPEKTNSEKLDIFPGETVSSHTSRNNNLPTELVPNYSSPSSPAPDKPPATNHPAEGKHKKEVKEKNKAKSEKHGTPLLKLAAKVTKMDSPPELYFQHNSELTAQQAELDFQTLEEQLLSIGQEPPRVARCIPKGVLADPNRFSRHRQMQHCIYGEEVYDNMLKNSLSVCDDLQHNLDDLIVEVRKTPSRENSPVIPNGNSSTQEEAKSPKSPVTSKEGPSGDISPKKSEKKPKKGKKDKHQDSELTSIENGKEKENDDTLPTSPEKIGTLKENMKENQKNKRRVFRLKF